MKSNEFDEMEHPSNEIQRRWHNELVEWAGQTVEEWIKSREIACISAFRRVLIQAVPNTDTATSQSRFLTIAENAERQNGLRAALLYWGYGILGEDFDDGLNSIMVVNIQNDSRFYDNLFKLSEYYNQDGFTYKAADDDVAYWVGTGHTAEPGYGQKVSVGYLHRKVDCDLIRRLEIRISKMSQIEEVMRSMSEPMVYGDMSSTRAKIVNEMDKEIEWYFVKDSLKMHSMYDRMSISCTARNVIHDAMQQNTKHSEQ